MTGTPVETPSDPRPPADASAGSEPGAVSRQERDPLLADAPLRDPAQDRFGFVAFAKALALIIDHERTATPLTIAVSAPWGGGKSSLGGMVETLLTDRVARRFGDDPRLVCWFNAWEHEDASHLGAALAGAVARAADRRRPWWRRAISPLPGAMLGARERVHRTWIIAAVSLAMAALLALSQPGEDLADQLLGINSLPAGGLGALGATAVAMLIFQRLFATAKSAASFIDDPRSEASRGSMSEVKQQLGTLIADATRDGRLVIFIDDLDRCESRRSLEVCRVASQLLAQEGVVTVLLADMSPIAASAAERFSVAGDPGDGDQAVQRADDVGRRYLEKIAQLELMLPPPDPADMRKVGSDYGAALRQGASSPTREMPRRSRLGKRARAPRTARREQRPTGGFESRWRAIRGVQRAGWWPLAAGVALLFLNFAVIDTAEDDLGSGPIFDLSMVLFTAGCVIAPWSMVLRLRARLRRNQLKDSIEQVKENTDLSPEEVAHHVISKSKSRSKRAPGYPDAERDLIGDLVSSSFLDSKEFQEVEHYLAQRPSRLPRQGKRVFNHAQLLTEIARERQMFGGTPALNPEHVAEWVVLRERWPSVGRTVLQDPSILGHLEDAAAAGQLEAKLDLYSLQVTELSALVEMLKNPPALGPVIERLVYFQPARATPTQRPAPSRASEQLV